MRHPRLAIDVVEHVGAEHEVARLRGAGFENGIRQHLDRWTVLRQVGAQVGVRLDRDRVLERVGEPRGHLAVASSGVDEDPARREPRDEALEPGARRRLLVGVVQEHLERSLVVAAQ